MSDCSWFTWDSTYTITVAGTPLVTEDAVVASETIEDGETWFYMLWKPLAAGTYLWLLTAQADALDDTGTFQVRYDSDSVKFDSYGDGILLGGDFEGGVMGLDVETYESVLSLGDAFTASYNTDGGHSGTKINRGTPNYANSIRSPDAVVDGSNVKIGRIASGFLVKVSN